MALVIQTGENLPDHPGQRIMVEEQKDANVTEEKIDVAELEEEVNVAECEEAMVIQNEELLPQTEERIVVANEDDPEEEENCSIEDVAPERIDTDVLYGARSFFALHVALGHYLSFITPFGDLQGSMAVSLFFILSGFVMTIGYGQKPNLNIPKFYFKRLARLLPVFWFMLVFILICFAASGDFQFDADFWKTFTLRFFLVDVYVTSIIQMPLGEAWALSVMMAFYICFPFIVGRFHNMSEGPDVSLKTFTSWSAGAWFAALAWATIYTYFIGWWLFPDATEMNDYFSYRIFLPARLVHFIMGITSASLIIHKCPVLLSADKCTAILLAVIFICWVTSHADPNIGFIGRFLNEYWMTPIMAAWLHALVMEKEESSTSRFFSVKIFRYIGDWSYVMYLSHMTIFFAYKFFISGNPDPFEEFIPMYHIFPCFIILFCWCFVVYNVIEVPCRKYLILLYEKCFENSTTN